MTKKQMEDLADLIVEKLMSKQKDLDQEFIEQLEKSNVPIEVHRKPDLKESMIMELTKLNVMLKQLESEERYEDAYLCSKRIEFVKEELSKLK